MLPRTTYFILFVLIQMIIRCNCAEIYKNDNNQAGSTNEKTDRSLETPQTKTASTSSVPNTSPSTGTSGPSQPSKSVGIQPAEPHKSSLIFNVVNNLGYDWYPLNADKLCDLDKLTDCKGGLACLVKKLSENKDVPLLSAGNALVDSTTKSDFFKALKFEPAVKALNVLKSYGLKALVMGPDVFRYGGSLANLFAENVTDVNLKMLACNLNSKKTFESHVDIAAKDSNSCGIRVIGFANADKMNQLRPENITVLNMVDSITSTIAENPRGKNLVVVMGEGTFELGKTISAIDGVDLVILSGSNDTSGEIIQPVTESGAKKFIISKALLKPVQLTVQVTEECKIADTIKAEEIEYKTLASNDCKIAPVLDTIGNTYYVYVKRVAYFYKPVSRSSSSATRPDRYSNGQKFCVLFVRRGLSSAGRNIKNVKDDSEKMKSINDSISAGYNKSETYGKDLSVKVISQLSSDSCHKSECTLGSIAADAIAWAAATENKDFPLDSRAILLPAGIFKNNATLTGPVSQKAFMDLIVDDEVFYNVNLTALQLKELLERMVNKTGVNFPQLSGFRLYLDFDGEYGEKVDVLHILGNHLLFENVKFDENSKVYRAILPLSFLLRNGIENLDLCPYNVTGVFLSEAVSSYFESQSRGHPFLPPPLGERITYVLPPTLSQCENLIAITVCYTFLTVVTISSVLLLGYKIYSDRTAVHYVR